MNLKRHITLTVLMALTVVLSLTITQAQDDDMRVLADFESGELFRDRDSNGTEIGFIPWGDTAENVVIEIVSSEGDLALPEQDGDNNVLQATYEVNAFGGFTHAFTDGEEWVAEDWTAYRTLEFWLYGANTGEQIQVEIFDNRNEVGIGDSAERFYYRVTDDFEGWQFIAIPFEYFQRRMDWQPGGAPADGLGLTEVHAYAFSFPTGTDQATNYIDNVAISNKEGNVADPFVEVVEGDDPVEAVELGDDSAMLADFQDEELFLGTDSDGLQIGYVTWGDSDNVSIEIVAAEGDLALPEQDDDNAVLQVTYDIDTFGGFTHAFTDGEAWVPQDWNAFSSFNFWLYGANSEAVIQVEIFDNRNEDANSDSAERFAYQFVDDFEGWQFFSIPFGAFQRRFDWQPNGAPADGFGLNEVHGYAFSFPAGVGEYVNYIDNVSVSNLDSTVEFDPWTSSMIETVPIELPEYSADGEWELVWSDEMDAEAGTPINAEFWTCQVSGHGWGNNQLEHTTDRIENVSHDGEGNLVITAREEFYRGNDYTAARCNTMDKVEVTYGRIEARIDLPEGQGMWPAFWMLGADFPEIGWPMSGEIDIMEYVGSEPRSIHGTVHGPEYNGSGGLGNRYIHDVPVADEFHVYGIEWEPDVIRWTFNGEVYHELTPEWLFGGTWVFDDDFFLILNIAVGGTWPGNPDDTTVFPQEMLVDWVRIYQRVAE